MYKIIGADGKEYGPITAEQLRQWISEGRINASTKVQTEGIAGWKTMSQMPEFAAALPAAPPPPLPVTPKPVAMPPAAPKSNQLAVWSMIAGIISIVTCCWAILGPTAIVLGIIALSQIKKNPGQTGSGFAIAGIVLGILSLIFAVIAIIVMVTSRQAFPNLQNMFPQ